MDTGLTTDRHRSVTRDDSESEQIQSQRFRTENSSLGVYERPHPVMPGPRRPCRVATATHCHFTSTVSVAVRQSRGDHTRPPRATPRHPTLSCPPPRPLHPRHEVPRPPRSCFCRRRGPRVVSLRWQCAGAPARRGPPHLLPRVRPRPQCTTPSPAGGPGRAHCHDGA